MGLTCLLAVACSTPAPPPPTAPTTESSAEAGAHGASDTVLLYAVQTRPLGVVATDGGGRLLYRFDGDSTTPPTSHCVDACTATWRPLLLPEGQDPELAGVRPELVGRLSRADGTTQVTLAGWPLYVRPDDDGQLRTAGAHGADGQWWVITPTGEKAAAP